MTRLNRPGLLRRVAALEQHVRPNEPPFVVRLLLVSLDGEITGERVIPMAAGGTSRRARGRRTRVT